MSFQTSEFNDGQYFYSVNVWRGTHFQIAVAYWVFLAQRGASTGRAIDLSLESFATEDASRVRDAYNRMKVAPLKPPDTPQQ